MVVEGASPTRRSDRERVQTPKAVQWSRKTRGTRDLNGSSEDETEDTIETVETPPAAPQPKRTAINAHPTDRIVATRLRALSTKAGERPSNSRSSEPRGGREGNSNRVFMQWPHSCPRSILSGLPLSTKAREQGYSTAYRGLF
jgi:hypothetical protein